MTHIALEWRRVPISPYRRYEVSSDGQVRRDGRILKGCVDRYGYRTLLLFYAGLSKRHKVHRLVCEAFHGPPPAGHEAAHLDGNAANNAADNLQWVTRSENNRHQYRHGRPASSNLTSYPQMSAEKRAAVIADARAGMGGRRLAAIHGISRSTAHVIQREAETPESQQP